MKQALIIFVRNPELGKVKTRIAASVGEEAALSIYKKLLSHMHQVTVSLLCDKYVFYADYIVMDDLWSKGIYEKQLQANTDLGQRMKMAFSELFQKGYKQIAIIGSDCLELTAFIVEQAFILLRQHDIVLGPANDGGYYLLAMSNEVKDIFQDIEWSTDKVLKQTLQRSKENNYTYALLPVLNDVDTIQDVPEEWKQELAFHNP